MVLMLQFVCLGGTPKRMEQFAYYIMEEIGHKLPAGTMLQDISQFSYRYSMYKVGPVLSISVSAYCLYELTGVSGGQDTA
jgi:uridine phosphorylase